MKFLSSNSNKLKLSSSQKNFDKNYNNCQHFVNAILALHVSTLYVLTRTLVDVYTHSLFTPKKCASVVKFNEF